MKKMAALQWLAVLGVSILIFTIPTKADENTGDDGPHQVVVENHDTEDDVKILDKDGNVLDTAIFDTYEGYEVEKPSDSDVCLLKLIDDADGICFKEDPVNYDLPETVTEFCKGRKILFLNSMPCDNTDDSDIDSRVKRSTSKSCYKVSYTCTRVCGSHCCKRRWGKCRRRCNNYCPGICFRETCITHSSG